MNANHSKSLKDAENRIEKLQSELKTDKELLEKRQSEHLEIKEDCEREKKSLIESFESKVEKQNARLKDFKTKMQNLETKLEEASQENLKLKESNDQLSLELTRANQNFEENASKLSALVRKLEMIEEEKRELRKEYDMRIKSVEANQNQIIDNLNKQHDDKLTQLKTRFEADVIDLSQKSQNFQIDLNSAEEKLAESLKDYKASIEKLKQASHQRYLKAKKKLTNAVNALDLVARSLFDEEENRKLLSGFVSGLSLNDKGKQSEANNGDDTANNEDALEFDEVKFKEIIENKKNKIEKNQKLIEGLKEIEKLKKEKIELSDNLTKFQDQTESLKTKIAQIESKSKVSNFDSLSLSLII